MTGLRHALALAGLVVVSSACTFVQMLEGAGTTGASALPDAAADGSPSGASDAPEGGDDAGPWLCPIEARGTAQDTPLGTVLVLAWERLDGKFFVERDRVAFSRDRGAFGVRTGEAPPPVDARVSASVPWLAIGHVYAVSVDVTASGLVDGASFRSAMAAGTYRDALVWSDAARPEDAGTTWASRTAPGYSVWRCADRAPKSEAFVESTCDGLRLESAGDPTGDRHCDWH